MTKKSKVAVILAGAGSLLMQASRRTQRFGVSKAQVREEAAFVRLALEFLEEELAVEKPLFPKTKGSKVSLCPECQDPECDNCCDKGAVRDEEEE